MSASTRSTEFRSRLTRATNCRRTLATDANALREEAGLHTRSGRPVPRTISVVLRRITAEAWHVGRHEGELRGHLYAAIGDAFPEEPR